MSSYENYDQTSGNYDETREPIGLGIILGCLARSLKTAWVPCSSMHWAFEEVVQFLGRPCDSL